jgi:error-prone DNA polymerase
VFAELAAASNFSFLRGASHPEELVVTAAALGLTGLALADRNSLAGAVRAHLAGREVGLRTAVGCRLVFEDDTPDILAWPTDRAAYGRLCRLLTDGNMRGGKGLCRLSIADLLLWCEGLVLAPVAETATPETLAAAVGALAPRATEPLRLALNVPYGADDQRALLRDAQLAAALGLRPLATSLPLYHAPERRPLQDVLTAIREHTTVDAAGRLLAPNAERHLKPPAEMARLFAAVPGAVTESLRVIERLTFSLDELRYEYPEEPTDPGRTPQETLERLTDDGARRRYPGGVPEKVRRLLAHELELIRSLDYAPYFITVYDVVRFAREKGILAQGRGSAANSAVCFCLGVTEVDPDRSDLLFERFISPERREPPDIDVDFEHERREEVIQYIYEKYGRDRAGIAATVITYRARSAAREIGKALGLSEDAVSSLSSTIWGWSTNGVTTDDAARAGLSPEDGRIGHLTRLSREIAGFPRHLSQHVGGFVITRGRLDELVPITKAAMDGRTNIEWDKDDIDALGILKIDVLALGMLTCVRKALALIAEHYAEDFPPPAAVPAMAAPLSLRTPACPPLRLVPDRPGAMASLGPASSDRTLPTDGIVETDPSPVRAVAKLGSLIQEAALPRERDVGFPSAARWETGRADGADLEPAPRSGGSTTTSAPELHAAPGAIETHSPPRLEAVASHLGTIGDDGIAALSDPASTAAPVPGPATGPAPAGVPRYRWPVTLATIPAEDPETYDMICRADTLGVFQIESRAQMSMLPRLRPRTFYDLVIEVAIVRPGPIQGDMVHPYLRRRQGKEAVTYPSEELKAVLGKTLGVPLFQEQAMRIAIVAAGFTPSEADQLRRAMATFKKVGTIGTFQTKMIEGMKAKGYDPDFAERCFRQIEGFGEYGFPESHAASFALLVYASCWLKCHYPDVFAAALLNSQPMGFYAPAQIVRDARLHGVEVRPVDVNLSAWDCTLEPGPRAADRLHPSHASMREAIRSRRAVRLGLRQVKGLSEADMTRLVGARGAGYDSVRDVWLRTGLPRATIERLADADAFASVGLSRRDALWAARGLDAAGRPEDLPLFAAAEHADLVREAAAHLPPMPPGEEVINDYRFLSLSLKAHPAAFVRRELAAERVLPAERIAAAAGRRASVAGLVLVRQRPGSAKGVIFMTVEDETGIANIIVWPKVFEAFRGVVLGARFVKITGRVQAQDDVVHLVADRLEDRTHLLTRLSETIAGWDALDHADEVKSPGVDLRTELKPRSRLARLLKERPELGRDAAALHGANRAVVEGLAAHRKAAEAIRREDGAGRKPAPAATWGTPRSAAPDWSHLGDRSATRRALPKGRNFH